MDWEPADVVAAILALAVLAFVLGIIASVFMYGTTSEEKAENIVQVLMAVVGVVGVYIGTKLRGK